MTGQIIAAENRAEAQKELLKVANHGLILAELLDSKLLERLLFGTKCVELLMQFWVL